uniref:EamA family transporter n=1 Tax=Flavobacterium sp. TaxID=239 RepID=UPI00404A5101
MLAIFFSSILYLIFKLFSKYQINNSQAIVFNYVSAFSIGLLISPIKINFETIISKPWFLGSFFLGFMFIYVFNILGKTTQINGISVASVSSKMAMIIPILFGIFIFNENIGIYKIIGILMALLAVYFTTKKEKGKPKSSNFTLPILLFIGAGIVDSSMNYIQYYFVEEKEVSLFASSTFFFAFVFGILLLSFKTIKLEQKINGKSILAGLFLGVPNYFSMYFLIQALQNKNLESATIFTLVNIGVILLTTIFSIIFFKEKLKTQNYIGIVLAIIAVFLVTN